MNPNLVRTGLVTLVFLLFLANAAGLLRLELTSSPHLAFGSQWFSAWMAENGGIRLPAYIWSSEMLLFVSTGIVLSIALPVLAPIPASILTLGLVVPPIYLNYLGYLESAAIPMEYFLLTILILYVVNVLIAYFEETHLRQQIIDTFSHYAPPEVVRELCRNPRDIPLHGEAREMTVIFCDLVSFSSIAERMQPTDLTRMLNEYFTRISNILHHHGATIDKFIGDSVMAFWGAPLSQPDHASRAVSASFDLHDSMKELQNFFDSQGWPRVEMRIGINSGMMNVGNMGTRHRITYTVIGDAVNIAARIEQLTRHYHVGTIVSEYTCEAAGEFIYRILDRVHIRGRQEPLLIYEPLCRREDAGEDLTHTVSINEQAVQAWLDRDLARASRLFAELRHISPEDRYAGTMLEKIQAAEPAVTR